jgi:hypothetical protein
MHAQLFLGLIKDEQCDYFDRAFEHLWQRLWLHGKAIHRGVHLMQVGYILIFIHFVIGLSTNWY